MDSLAAIIVIVCAFTGVALTVLTLPGIWFALLVGVIAELWRGGGEGAFISWWTLGTCLGMGVVAEGVELFASAAGSTKMGGTKRGAIGSLVGALVGAIGGTPFFPPLGTILGGALGAGIGALLLERHGKMSWKGSMKVGGGAAAGRFVATLAKMGFALVVAGILCVAVLR